MDRRPSPRKTKIGPALTVKCGRCGRKLGNPLTHRCTERTDFKRRKTAAEKPKPAPKAAPQTGDKHEYQACDDQDCPRYICRVYKEGFANGWTRGYDRGYAAGWAAGYDAGYRKGYDAGYKKGFTDGIAACPRPHQ